MAKKRRPANRGPSPWLTLWAQVLGAVINLARFAQEALD